MSIYRKHATRELLRPCDIRFATYYITLNRVVEEKASLRLTVCSNEWEKSPLSKTSKAKLVEEIISSSKFWESAKRVLNMCQPIMEMLRLVDSDTPCMGFVYEGMEHCKEAIARVFNNVIDDYKLIWDMVDFRWKMVHSPLHATACYLDPRSFGIKRNGDKKIMSGLYEAIEKLNPDREVAKKVREQLRAYKLQEGIFGSVEVREDRTCVAPRVWWDFYGAEAPELQRFAIRVLSQGSSATASERNWSAFDFIHSKRRNNLASKKLEDLVYVHSNLQLSTHNVAKDSSNVSSSQVQDIPEDHVEYESTHSSSGHNSSALLHQVLLMI